MEQTVTDKKAKIDWLLLIFLLLFTNQAMFSVKLLGLLFVYLARPNLKFGLKKNRIPLFYLLIVLSATINQVLFVRDYSTEYIYAFLIGNSFWIFSFLAFHQVKLSVEKFGAESMHKTIKAYTVLHFAFCIGQLLHIIILTGKLNPYTGLGFPYGMSTGDNIFGTFMQNSYYNIMVSSMLTLYFIYKKNALFTLLATTCFVLVFGNFGVFIFSGVILGMLGIGVLNNLYTAVTRRPAKWLSKIAPLGAYWLYIPGIFLFISVFYIALSPDNADYVVQKVKSKIYEVATTGKNSFKTIIENQKFDPNVFDLYYQSEVDIALSEGRESKKLLFSDLLQKLQSPNANERVELKRAMTQVYIQKLQGKNLSVLETRQFLKTSLHAFLFGAGTTRFSSLTAQKMAGYDSSKLFMQVIPHFSAPEYNENHKLLIEERIKAEDDALLSTANWPDSLYNQLLGEYGVIGALLFLFFYLGYFIKHIGKWSYSLWILILLLPFAHLNYIFDTLCVMPFFEWLLLTNIAEAKQDS